MSCNDVDVVSDKFLIEIVFWNILFEVNQHSVGKTSHTSTQTLTALNCAHSGDDLLGTGT